ncbi:MAG: HypC/HybG/HupF family hydrogenase formation chaperone [Synergistales bacterium]
MCLAVPHTLVAITGSQTAIGRAGTIEVEIRTDLIENPVIGESVLVHAGFAIEKLRPEEATEIEALWEEIRTHSERLSDE